MLFGLHNTPDTFQRLMNTVLADVKNCEVYLDDVVTLKVIFGRLREA